MFYSTTSLREVLHREKRKGNFSVRRLFESGSVASLKRDRRALYKSLDGLVAEGEREKNLNKIKTINEEIETLLLATLADLSARMSSYDYKFSFKKLSLKDGKQLFGMDKKSPVDFLVEKQMQHVLSKSFGVKQANRHAIVANVLKMLDCDFPLVAVKSDIQSFFESLPIEAVVNRLSSSGNLDYLTCKFLKELISEQKNHGCLGAPRGLGISSYLTEFYLQGLDRKLKSLPNVVMYNRFVDDIMIVFAKSPLVAPGDLKLKVITEIQNFGFAVNEDKTNEVDTNQSEWEMSYLGYTFGQKNNRFFVAPSDEKVNRIKLKFNKLISCYLDIRRTDIKLAHKTLKAGLKMLAGNVRVHNLRSGALTGIYFSSPHLTDISKLKEIDDEIKGRLIGLGFGVNNSMCQFSLVEGFEKRKFYKISRAERKLVHRAWKK